MFVKKIKLTSSLVLPPQTIKNYTVISVGKLKTIFVK